MSTRTTEYIQADLQHKFLGEANPIQGSVFLALATDTGECTYGGYSRIELTTDLTNFTGSGAQITNVEDIYFPARTDEGLEVVTHLQLYNNSTGGMLCHDQLLEVTDHRYVYKGIQLMIPSGSLVITGQ